jgi:hypothetical protein
MWWLGVFLLLLQAIGFAQGTASNSTQPTLTLAQQAKAIKEAGLDPEACFRVRDLRIRRPGLSIYLNEGLLIFTKPVAGRRFGAVFSGEIEGGDAEVLVVPPTTIERRALSAITESPTFNEHFRSAALMFGDDTAEQLIAEIKEKSVPGLRDDDGPSLASRYSEGIKQLANAFAVRLTEEALMQQSNLPGVGWLLLSFANAQRGTVDIVLDPLWDESLLLGAPEALESGNDRRKFLAWTQFRPKGMPNADPFAGLHTTNVEIDASLAENLELSSKVAIEVQAGDRATRVLPFFMSRRMRITSVTSNGVPLEFLQREDPAVELRRDESDTFLVLLPQALPAKQKVTIEFKTQGKVVEEAAQKVYFVGARSSWYPHIAIDMAPHRIKMRYPAKLQLVLPGDEIHHAEDALWKTTERQISQSVRLVGFNLGEFSVASEKRPPITVHLFSDLKLQDNYQTQVRTMPSTSLPVRRGVAGAGPGMVMQTEMIPAIPRRVQLLREISDGLRFLETILGPPPLPVVSVAPIPGNFGQGFPGVIYLPTASWLPIRTMIGADRSPEVISELLTVHEAGHQWFGNQTYTVERRDDWLMEALASYAALLFVEKKQGKATVDQLLQEFRDRLLLRGEDGKPIEQTGPLNWGTRLQMTKNSLAWQRITYDKGTWVIHMLRQRMGKEKFLQMLRVMQTEFARKPMSTDQFRQLAAKFLSANDPDKQLELLFEQFVGATGIPKLSLTTKTGLGTRQVKVELTQSGVSNEFAMHVPLEMKLSDGKLITKWILSGPEPIEIIFEAPAAIRSVQLDPHHWVLRQ